MSEKRTPDGGGAEFQPNNVETEAHPEHAEVVNDTSENQPEKARHSVEDISKKVEQHAISGKESAPATEHSEGNKHPAIVNKQLKDMAYSRAITRVRKRLSRPSRILSTIVHSPLVDKPSELASKTIARPSGMLGGGLVAAVGTLLLYILVNRYGYEYNYLAVILLFAGGMVAGLAIEGTVRLLRRR